MRAFAFSLIAWSAAAAAQQSPPAPAPPPEKLRCHVHAETGSLAKSVRECHTPSEWQKIADRARADAEYNCQVIK